MQAQPAVPAAVLEQADATDIQASLRGDHDAFARLVQRYQATIGTQMWRFTRDKAQYEELLHEVFVEAYLSLPKFKGNSPFVHWLRKIAVRVGYRFWKEKARWKRRAVQALPEHMEVGRVDGSIEAIEAAAEVHAVLDQLPPRDRLVMTLLYFDQHSIAAASELIGWSQTMVKVQAHRARKKLKKLLEQQS